MLPGLNSGGLGAEPPRRADTPTRGCPHSSGSGHGEGPLDLDISFARLFDAFYKTMLPAITKAMTAPNPFYDYFKGKQQR